MSAELEDTAEHVEIAAADWSILDHPIVEEVLALASAKVGGAHASVTSADDMHQEGSIWLALNADLVRTYLADELLGQRALYRRLHSRLLNATATDSARASRHVSYDLLNEPRSNDNE